MRVRATHLGLSRDERKYQIAQLSLLLAGSQMPMVLLGGFNILWQPRALAPLARLGFEHRSVRSFPTWTIPLLALDRIFADTPAAAIQRCWRHETPLARTASDHFPIVAEVQVAR
jgi:endonuclease/exonuclease/phosphatase family metal-dependent hydrolase